MDVDVFTFNQVPVFEIASNTFARVPVILQYENTPLIQVVREMQAGFTTEASIYHEDGTYLARVRGSRLFPTSEGTKAGVSIRHEPQLVVCEISDRTAFELRYVAPAAVRGAAELHTPDGAFLKMDRAVSGYVKMDGNCLAVGGVFMSGNRFIDCRIGVHVHKDGSVDLGVS
jgi:hypothetical protein